MNKKHKIALLQILSIREDIGKSAFNKIIKEIDANNNINDFFKKIDDNEKKSVEISEKEKSKMINEIKDRLISISKSSDIDINNFLAKLDMAGMIDNSDDLTIENIIQAMNKKNNRDIKSVVNKIINANKKEKSDSYETLAKYIIDK